MSITDKDVQKMAILAKILIDDADAKNYAKDMSNILDLVAAMNEIDTAGIKPLAHPLEESARLREDKPNPDVPQELYQSLAPETQQDHYLVPKVIE